MKLEREYWVYFCNDSYFFVPPNTCDCACRLKQHIVVGETTTEMIKQITKSILLTVHGCRMANLV